MDEKRDPPKATPESLSRELGLDAEALAIRLAFFDLTAEDEARLRELEPLCDRHIDRIVADFHAHLLRFPALEELLRAEPGRLARLERLQRDYFHRLAEGRIDESYVESRLRVGNAHQRIGLEPQWYIGAFGLFLRLCLRELMTEHSDGQRILASLESLIKAVFLDMSLAIDTYIWGGYVDREFAGQLQRATQTAEDALHAKQHTERLKDDLTSMVVHDLKNPVNGIAMMVQLALRKGGDLPEAHRGYLRQIDRTCREMMRLIQNLLEIGKIEEGRMPVEHVAIAAGEIASDVAREYGPVAEELGRRLRVEVSAGLPDMLGDRALLRRVLVNLVTNALRHSGSPEVQLDARAEPDGDLVTLRVVDHGEGIDEADQQRIFDKFRSGRSPVSDPPAGDTGLGLAFCKLAVELMGGRIGVRSDRREGTSFWVTLPRHSPP